MVKRFYPLDKIDSNPIKEFEKWFALAKKHGQMDPDAMTLATATKKGKPSARIVLFKGLKKGSFLFYTNYESKKGLELISNPQAALVFYWAGIYRQVRIEGSVSQLTHEESENYFLTRARESQIAAWASHQSRKIKNFNETKRKYERLEKEFKGESIPLPSYWGGFCLAPKTIEFWLGQNHRLHHRFLFAKKSSQKWALTYLAP